MGNYEELKQAVSDVIKTNGNQEITGAILQNVLLTIISTVGNGATFAGIATPTTNPGTPDQNLFYIASENGTYSNFNGFILNNEVAILSNENGNWVKTNTGLATQLQFSELESSKQEKLIFDDIPTVGSSNPVTSGGVRQAIDVQKDEVNKAKDEAIKAIYDTEESAIANFSSQRVTPEMLSESTKQLIEASGGGTITNLADDEDIESRDDGTGSNVLKLKDRAYNPVNFSGKGYKILRKNIVDRKNVLTQEMINEPNTIYEIRYDFDLNNEAIYIPKECILDFKGGSLNNGVIYSNQTKIINIYKELDIIGKIYNIDGNEITIRGDVIDRNCKLYSYWRPISPDIDTAIRNARNIGITDWICILHVVNDENENFSIEEEKQAKTPEMLKNSIKRNNIIIDAIKFHTDKGFTDRGINTVKAYSNFVYNYIVKCKELNIEFNSVFIVNEESDWTSSTNTELRECIIELANKIKDLGLEPCISYNGVWSARYRGIQEATPGINFYPTISYSDEKSVYSEDILKDLISYYFDGLFPLLNKFTTKEVGLSETGCCGATKGLRTPYYDFTYNIGEPCPYILYLYWKYIINLVNVVGLKYVCVWFIGQFDPNDYDISIDTCYNIFKTLK